MQFEKILIQSKISILKHEFQLRFKIIDLLMPLLVWCPSSFALFVFLFSLPYRFFPSLNSDLLSTFDIWTTWFSIKRSICRMKFFSQTTAGNVQITSVINEWFPRCEKIPACTCKSRFLYKLIRMFHHRHYARWYLTYNSRQQICIYASLSVHAWMQTAKQKQRDILIKVFTLFLRSKKEISLPNFF